MTTDKQINANQQNSLASTGPRTEDGKQRAALNSTRHGFTGQKVFIHPNEKDAYEAHVQTYLEEFDPLTGEERDLVQQYTDHRWTLQQISVQQTNAMTVIATLTNQHLESGDIAGMGAALEPHTKLLNTLAIYEQRRRRAAGDALARFKEVHAANYKRQRNGLEYASAVHLSFREAGKTWDPGRFGFDCSIPDMEDFLSLQEDKMKLDALAKAGFKYLHAHLEDQFSRK